MTHTCVGNDRINCEPCRAFERTLWDAIHAYAIAVGGSPASSGSSTPRERAVAAVDKILAQVRARERLDEIVIEDLVKGGNGAASAACLRGAEIARLRVALIDVRGFLRGFAGRPELSRGSQDLLDEAAALDRVLDEKGAP